MTEITDEVLWASSEEGNAAHKAAWDRAQELGLAADRAEIGAVVWAAYQAAQAERADEEGPEDGAVAGHQHTWTILRAQEAPAATVFIGKPVPRTAVLVRCTECGEPRSWLLNGTWTAADLADAQPE